MKKIIKNWIERHQNPTSFWLHMAGIPMTIVGIGFAVFQSWWWAIGLFVGGYFIQWIGHLIEGNDMGELILFKKMLGMPYIAVVPRKQDSTPQS